MIDNLLIHVLICFNIWKKMVFGGGAEEVRGFEPSGWFLRHGTELLLPTQANWSAKYREKDLIGDRYYHFHLTANEPCTLSIFACELEYSLCLLYLILILLFTTTLSSSSHNYYGNNMLCCIMIIHNRLKCNLGDIILKLSLLFLILFYLLNC